MEITDFTSKYLSSFKDCLGKIETKLKNDGKPVIFSKGIEIGVDWIKEVQKSNNKIIFIGNGGSDTIASHQAIDFWNNGKVRAVTFNDSSLLTCISNDYGYEQVFSKPMEAFADNGDIAICISSSGSSKNIFLGAEQAVRQGCKVITLSGFSEDNHLRSLGDLNFYVPSFSYGFVEIIHLIICHCLLDAKLYCCDNKDIYFKNELL